MKIRNYRDALDYFYSFIDYERRSGWKYNDKTFSLDRLRSFLDRISAPHRSGRFIHIAGTNGKGSVAAIAAKTLSAAGYRTGLYTSPHLLSFRERIRIDGVSISHEECIDAARRFSEETAEFPGLTFFEVWTALAFDHFARNNTDIAVIETGMGGRLDASSVIIPDVSVITPISMDHCGILGDTLAAIAGEKAGIIKPGVPVISAKQEPEALTSIKRAARDNKSTLFLAGSDFKHAGNPEYFEYSGIHWHFSIENPALHGAMQSDNAALACAALEMLDENGMSVSIENMRKGLRTVSWPGRLQVIAHSPEVILDGACNLSAASALIDFADSCMPNGKRVAVVAMCSDKSIAEFLGLLADSVDHFVFCAVENPRAKSAGELLAMLAGGAVGETSLDSGSAIERGRELAGADGQVLVTGSLYLVGEALRHFGVEYLDRI